MDKIDFVILWVDGSDIEWLNEKKQYDKSIVDASSCAARFRDWDNLQYWFRGVERFAPWVNRVFFITWGHIPKWLDKDHPKLRIIKHTDFIPQEYLPTYNSNAIELNLHRIADLSEQFVLFNDDMFLIRATKEKDFFVKGKPRDEFVMDAIVSHPAMPIIGHTSINNVGVINKYFKKREVLKNQFLRIYNPQYGSEIIRNILLSFWNDFTGFKNPHIPLPHLKSTFFTLWDKEYALMHDTCLNKFRQYNDLNHWVMRYWNLCEGNYKPRAHGFGKLFNVGNNNEKAISYIINQKGKTICVNDYITEFDFEKAVAEFKGAFESILPLKSSFEID